LNVAGRAAPILARKMQKLSLANRPGGGTLVTVWLP
jgi:hypothetical protein